MHRRSVIERGTAADESQSLTRRCDCVVVGVSSSVPMRAETLDAAVRWAARRHLTLRLVSGATVPPGGGLGGDLLQRRRNLETAVQTVRRLCAEQRVSLTIDTSTSTDFAPELLLDESRRASVIVLERRRLSRLARLTERSVSSQVAARAACPVLIVHGGEPVGTRRAGDVMSAANRTGGVWVGVDGRGHSRRALMEAFKEAWMRKAVLVALTSWSPPVTGVVPPSAAAVAAARNAARRLLDEQLVHPMAIYPDVAVRRSVVRADVTAALVAATGKAELLVLARHTGDRHGLRRLGAVAARVVDRAMCPVLVTAASGGSDGRRADRRLLVAAGLHDQSPGRARRRLAASE